VPNVRAIANEPVTMLLSQAVEPSPVDTIKPEEDWNSFFDPCERS
jgi:hypothetical protein